MCAARKGLASPLLATNPPQLLVALATPQALRIRLASKTLEGRLSVRLLTRLSLSDRPSTKRPRSRGELLVALKELPLSDIGLFGATDQEVSAGVGRMCKEVEILSSLSHPNIVQVGRGWYVSVAAVRAVLERH